jgi:hypothetical protein
MAHVDFQKLHDVLQELVQAAGQVHVVVTADFPEVREKIREWVAEGEYAVDPLMPTGPLAAPNPSTSKSPFPESSHEDRYRRHEPVACDGNARHSRPLWR